MAKAKKLPSGNWRVQASVTVNGNTIRRSFTESTAKKAERKAEDWVSQYKIIGSDYSRMTVKEAILFYISTNDNKLSPSTIREYERISKTDMQDIIDKPLYSLTCPIIDASINNALKKLSPKTVRNRYGLLKRILSVYHPSFVWTITFPEPAPKKKREFSNTYVKNILNAAKENPFELEIYLGMLSMRESEIAGLIWSEVDLKNKKLYVCRSMILDRNNNYVLVDHNKTNKSTRTIYLPDYVCKLLEKRQAISQSEYVTDTPPCSFWDKFNAILLNNNIEPLKFHGLRHIYSSISSTLKIDSQIRMDNGGWSSEKVMDGNYRHPISEAQIDANNKMNNYINEALDTVPQKWKPKRLKMVRRL